MNNCAAKKVFKNSICANPPKKNSVTKKTDYFYKNYICRMDLLDVNDYAPQVFESYRHIIVVIEKFSMFGWTVSIKNKQAQTMRVFLKAS